MNLMFFSSYNKYPLTNPIKWYKIIKLQNKEVLELVKNSKTNKPDAKEYAAKVQRQTNPSQYWAIKYLERCLAAEQKA